MATKSKSQRVSPYATRKQRAAARKTAERRPTTQGRPSPARPKKEPPAPPAPVARARQHTATPRAPKAATEQTEVGYKVRAIEIGYYDHARRRPGDVFLIAKPEDFSERWMEYVDADTPERISTANQEIRRKNVETAVARMPGAVMPMVHDEPMANDPKNPLKA